MRGARREGEGAWVLMEPQVSPWYRGACEQRLAAARLLILYLTVIKKELLTGRLLLRCYTAPGIFNNTFFLAQ